MSHSLPVRRPPSFKLRQARAPHRIRPPASSIDASAPFPAPSEQASGRKTPISHSGGQKIAISPVPCRSQLQRQELDLGKRKCLARRPSRKRRKGCEIGVFRPLGFEPAPSIRPLPRRPPPAPALLAAPQRLASTPPFALRRLPFSPLPSPPLAALPGARHPLSPHSPPPRRLPSPSLPPPAFSKTRPRRLPCVLRFLLQNNLQVCIIASINSCIANY